ncbi:MAG: esterase/lipase family protein [Dehalococcoidia bacterium]
MATRRVLDDRFRSNAALPLWREAFLGIDWLSLRVAPVFRGIGVPKGDGAAVIVIPGFLGSDQYLGDMNSWLRRIGYSPYLSGIGRNAECPEVLSSRLHETIKRARKETGGKVHLIGHSLGGVLARGAAVRWKRQIASVTTMASPFRGVTVHPFVLQTAFVVRGRIRQRRNGPKVLPQCFSGDCRCDFLSALRSKFPASIPKQAIYTKTDGVVDWRFCIDEEDTDVEVRGTHVGLAFNPHVYRVLAKFLAESHDSREEEVA